jgi:phosphoglycerate dehydrogenase-like enzyme
MKLLVPDSVDLDLDLPDDVQTVVYAIEKPIPGEHADADVLVVWGNPPGQLRDAATRLRRLRWVQTLAAGPDAVLEAGFAPEVVVTAGLGLHDLTVTEHALTLVLAAARRLNMLVRAQVTIWGFGGIAATLAPHLRALGARVTGVARTAGERDGFPVATADAFPDLLPRTDVLLMILPATPETVHALDAPVLALLPRHAWLVNVGRGTTVDERAVLDAVRSGRLAGAALDVFETEPLPPDSGLWDEPNVILTPHAAGGRPIGAAARIAENVALVRAGAPLRHTVER